MLYQGWRPDRNLRQIVVIRFVGTFFLINSTFILLSVSQSFCILINCDSTNNQMIPQPHESEIKRMDLPYIWCVEVPNSAQLENMLNKVEQTREWDILRRAVWAVKAASEPPLANECSQILFLLRNKYLSNICYIFVKYLLNICQSSIRASAAKRMFTNFVPAA